MGIATADEPALWQRARGGDAEAFAQLFDAHYGRVFGQALRLQRSAHDAEDVTAIVFLEAWRRRDSVRVVNGSIVGWLLVTTNYVVSNLARGQRRHRVALSRLTPAVDEGAAFEEVDDRLDGSRRSERLQNGFAELSRNDQNVITLCVIEGLALADAAAALGVPIGTVKSRLSRAKARLTALTLEAPAATTTSGGAL